LEKGSGNMNEPDQLNDMSCIVNLVEDIWCVMEEKGYHTFDIAELWRKDIEVVEQFLVHDDPTILTVKDLLELAAFLGKRLVVTFD
jgi:tRNA A58 N-methylase Trm61